jgi:hypothetical protein
MFRVPFESFPVFYRVRQAFPEAPPLDVEAELDKSWCFEVAPGARVAVTVGSRGITRQREVLLAVLRRLQAAGAKPFIVPAMGSHGGASAEGQAELLASYGITEESMGVPIEAAMAASVVGHTKDGLPAHIANSALAADAILLFNRVKPHSEFRGPIESGLLKMLVVGLGKEPGATMFHSAFLRHGFSHALQTLARVKLEHAPVLGGIALLEDQRHELSAIEAVPASELFTREPQLLERARRLMPTLGFTDIDLLIVDEMGKNISGGGIDPNVIGRDCYGYSSHFQQIPEPKPFVRRLFVRDLTPESHGNAIGIGVADFTTTRLVNSIDYPTMAMNALTSQVVQAAKIPLHFATDRLALEHAMASLGLNDPREARVVRMVNSLSLERLQISEALLEEARGLPGFHLEPGLAPLELDEAGTLRAF